MIASEWLGLGHQFQALLTQFVHQTHEAQIALGVISQDQLLIIKPEFLDLTSPEFFRGVRNAIRCTPTSSWTGVN